MQNPIWDQQQLLACSVKVKVVIPTLFVLPLRFRDV